MGYLKRAGPKCYRYAYEGPKMNGKRQQLTGTFYDLTKAEAEAELTRLEALARNGEHVKNPNLTLKQLFGEFMKRKQQTVEASTFERYEMFGRLYILPRFGDIKVRDIRQSNLVDAYGEWRVSGSRKKPISGRTVHHVHDLIRCVLNFGVRRDLLARNVAALIPSEDLPKASKPEPRALNEREVTRLLDAARNPSERAKRSGGPSAEPWFYPAVAFAVYTGARRGEVLGLRWSDVGIESKTATIRRSLARVHSKGLFFKEPKNDKARTIVLPAPLVAILGQHRAAQQRERTALGIGYKDNDLVFARPDGSLVNPRSFGNRVIELAVRANVTPITAHCLRDTHASLLAKKGVPIEVVSKRLGHADIRVTTERYLHVYNDRDAAAASALDTLCG